MGLEQNLRFTLMVTMLVVLSAVRVLEAKEMRFPSSHRPVRRTRSKRFLEYTLVSQAEGTLVDNYHLSEASSRRAF